MEATKLENYTYEDFLQIDKSTPQNERYELIFGKIYAMSGASAKHQDLVLNIAFVLKNFQKESKCLPRVAPYDLKLELKGTINVVQPDIMLFCEDDKTICAIFEVLSPSTAYKDRGVKKELYENAGILNYFIVDPLAKTIEKFLLQKKKYIYEKCYGIDNESDIADDMYIECIDKTVNLKDIFE